MRLFQDKFSIYKKAGEPLYKTPKSVQECIEILKVAPDGIFEVAGNRYSKSYLFSDVNYNTTSAVLKGKLPTAQNKCSALKFLFLFLDLGVVIHNPWLQIPPLLFFCG